MEQIFFLVLVGFVGLVRLLMQIAEKKKNAEAQKLGSPNIPPTRGPAQSEEERVRKFFEALGVPTSAAPPPRVPPRKITPTTPRRKPLIDPFPVPRSGGLPPVSTPPPVSVPLAPAIPVEPVRERIPKIASLPIAPAGFEVRDVSSVAESVLPPTRSSSQAGVARLLTGDSLRDAMVLREILGPPRSMQPFSHTV